MQIHEIFDKTQQYLLKQRSKILDRDQNYSTGVTTRIDLTQHIQYPISKTTYINSKSVTINK